MKKGVNLDNIYGQLEPYMVRDHPTIGDPYRASRLGPMMQLADFNEIRGNPIQGFKYDHVRIAIDPYCFGALSQPGLLNAGDLPLWNAGSNSLGQKYKDCFMELKHDIDAAQAAGLGVVLELRCKMNGPGVPGPTAAHGSFEWWRNQWTAAGLAVKTSWPGVYKYEFATKPPAALSVGPNNALPRFWTTFLQNLKSAYGGAAGWQQNKLAFQVMSEGFNDLAMGTAMPGWSTNSQELFDNEFTAQANFTWRALVKLAIASIEAQCPGHTIIVSPPRSISFDLIEYKGPDFQGMKDDRPYTHLSEPNGVRYWDTYNIRFRGYAPTEVGSAFQRLVYDIHIYEPFPLTHFGGTVPPVYQQDGHFFPLPSILPEAAARGDVVQRVFDQINHWKQEEKTFTGAWPAIWIGEFGYYRNGGRRLDLPFDLGGQSVPGFVEPEDSPYGAQINRHRWLYDVRTAVVDQLKSLNSVVYPVDPQGNITGPPTYNYDYNSGWCTYQYSGRVTGAFAANMWDENNFEQRWPTIPRPADPYTTQALITGPRP